MPQRHRLASVSDLADGQGREFVVEGRIIALFRIGDRFLALDGICPHAGGPLARGTISNCMVTCPWHGWQFHLETGQHVLNPRLTQSAFPLIVDGVEIFIDFP